MIIELNGKPHELDGATTLAELIEAVTGSLRGSAAAVEDTVVPRGDWTGYQLRPGQRVELIRAVQGG